MIMILATLLIAYISSSETETKQIERLKTFVDIDNKEKLIENKNMRNLLSGYNSHFINFKIELNNLSIENVQQKSNDQTQAIIYGIYKHKVITKIWLQIKNNKITLIYYIPKNDIQFEQLEDYQFSSKNNEEEGIIIIDKIIDIKEIPFSLLSLIDIQEKEKDMNQGFLNKIKNNLLRDNGDVDFYQTFVFNEHVNSI